MFGDLVKKALPTILERLKTVQIDHTHNIPFCGGQSKTENRVYIDSRVPAELHLNGNSYNTLEYLGFHELVEKAIEDVCGVDYDTAHNEAERAMILFIKKDGLDPVPFNEYISKMYPWTLSHFDPEKVPEDLDTRPYVQDKKRNVLKKLGVKST